MTKQEILAKVDHTLLKADAGWEDIRRICDEALENSTASICINPCWVERAVEYLGGRVPVCTVIGFRLEPRRRRQRWLRQSRRWPRDARSSIWSSTSAG